MNKLFKNKLKIIFILSFGLSIQCKSQNVEDFFPSKYFSQINLGFEDRPEYYWIDIVDTLDYKNNLYLLELRDDNKNVISKIKYIQINKYSDVKWHSDTFLISRYVGIRLLTVKDDDSYLLFLKLETNIVEINEKKYFTIPSIEERDTLEFVLPIGLGDMYKISIINIDKNIALISMIDVYGNFSKKEYQINAGLINFPITPAYYNKKTQSIFTINPFYELKIIDP